MNTEKLETHLNPHEINELMQKVFDMAHEGKSLYNQGKYDCSKVVFEETLDIMPEFWVAKIDLVLCNLRLLGISENNIGIIQDLEQVSNWIYNSFVEIFRVTNQSSND